MATAVSAPLYGRAMGEYSIEDLRILLSQEEERLQELKAAINEKKAQTEGKSGKSRDKSGQRIFDEKEIQRIREMFNKMDTDGTGELDPDELTTIVREKLCCAMPKEEVIESLKELDTDGNGKVSFDEFIQWWGADVNHSRYKANTLLALRGRLRAEEGIGMMGSWKKLALDGQRAQKMVTADASIQIGDCAKAKTSEIAMTVRPAAAEPFFNATDRILPKYNVVLPEDDGWISLSKEPSAELWRNFKTFSQDYIAYSK
eukprot:gene14625-22370_t